MEKAAAKDSRRERRVSKAVEGEPGGRVPIAREKAKPTTKMPGEDDTSLVATSISQASSGRASAAGS